VVIQVSAAKAELDSRRRCLYRKGKASVIILIFVFFKAENAEERDPGITFITDEGNVSSVISRNSLVLIWWGPGQFRDQGVNFDLSSPGKWMISIINT